MSLSDRKEREKEQRRTDILDAAEQLFFANKFDDVSMDDIAKDVELSKATLYLYFKNKESLYFAIMQRGLRIMRDRFLEAVNDDMWGLEKISALCHAFFKYCQDHPEYYQLMCDARSRRFDMGQVEGMEEQMVTANEIMDCIYRSVKDGIADGTLRKGLDPIKTAIYIMANCENIMHPDVNVSWFMGGNDIRREEYLEHSLGLLVYAISGSDEKLSNKAV